MKAQAQFTIHSLNDVIASTTAPSSPYKGQLWVNTSYSPPRTFVYNGSAWKEQNGTDTLRSNISTLTTKSNTMRSDLDGLTSTVSGFTTRVETVEDDLGVVEENILDVQSNVSELEQTASSIALRVTQNEASISSLSVDIGGLKTRVSNAEGEISTLEQTTSSLSATVASKVSSSGGTTSSFGWSLTASGFRLYSQSSTVMLVTSSGLTINGTINATSGTLSELYILGNIYFGEGGSYFLNPNYDNGSWYIYLPKFRVDDTSAYFSGTLQAPSGTIGGFTISTSAIYKTKTSYSSTTAGVYIGTTGIGLGAGTFYVTSAGYLYCTSGQVGGFSIGASSLYNTKTAYSSTTAGVYVGTDGIGLGAGTFYVTSAGALYSTSGTVGGFSIGANSLYKTKTAYSNSTAGVYLGTDGIGLGAGTFYVTSAGALTATSATITGAITATSGSVQNMTVKGRLYFGNNSTYYLDANYNDTSYYIYLPGFRVDDASGAVFSGKLSAASGSFSGTITATGGKIGSLNISDGGLLYGSVSTDNVATGVKINTTGIWAKEGHFSQGSFGYWFLSSSGYFWALYNRSLDIYLKSSGPTLGSSSASWASVITSANSSSDARLKKDVAPLSARYETFFDNLTPRSFRYIDGTSGRHHTGFVAQEVVSALGSAGLSTQDFAGVVLWSAGTKDECWHLRKDEFVALNTWEIQKLKRRVAELEAIIQNREVHQ